MLTIYIYIYNMLTDAAWEVPADDLRSPDGRYVVTGTSLSKNALGLLVLSWPCRVEMDRERERSQPKLLRQF